jgi:hypothetical protein
VENFHRFERLKHSTVNPKAFMARLQKDIKGVELQIKEVDARLQERISQLEVSLHQTLVAQTRWLIGGLTILGVVLKLADVLIGP